MLEIKGANPQISEKQKIIFKQIFIKSYLDYRKKLAINNTKSINRKHAVNNEQSEDNSQERKNSRENNTSLESNDRREIINGLEINNSQEIKNNQPASNSHEIDNYHTTKPNKAKKRAKRTDLNSLIKNISDSKIIDQLTNKLIKKVLKNCMLPNKPYDSNSEEFENVGSVERIDIILGDINDDEAKKMRKND